MAEGAVVELFMCWSGDTSLAIAVKLREWFRKSCTGCHAGGHPAGELKLNGGASSAFPAVSARVNVGLPCDSLILKKPSTTNCIGGAVSHDGGTLWSTNGSPYQTTLTWIQEGAANN